MSDSAARPSREYVLTHTDTERRRLALQASIINPFTDRFLRDTGISGAMHVLDFGCGVGDVSLAVGRLVGAHGSVTGVDIDPEALAIATNRAKEEGLDHVRFVQSDLGEFEAETKYDAVTARHILIHTLDPVALIRRARGFVRPGGIIAFQEYDLSFCGPRFDDLPVWTTCVNAITAVFARTGLPVRAGALLYLDPAHSDRRKWLEKPDWWALRAIPPLSRYSNRRLGYGECSDRLEMFGWLVITRV
jgi:ubiquinone/menaquinone biosynthesis C-methylase UbiE